MIINMFVMIVRPSNFKSILKQEKIALNFVCVLLSLLLAEKTFEIPLNYELVSILI